MGYRDTAWRTRGDIQVTAPVTVLSPAAAYNSCAARPCRPEEIDPMPSVRPIAHPLSRTRSRRRGSVAVIAAGAAVVITGCGGSALPPATGTSAQSIQHPVTAAFRFSACMREHGVTNFPDPVVHSSPGQQSIGIHVTPALVGSPQFKSAQKSCASILPAPSGGDQAQQQRNQVKGMLSFTRCVRAHGINGFPDPNAQGQLTPQMLSTANIDVHAPSVLTAAKACISESDGQVNAAAIRQAANTGS
jgi:hypothetical protein